MKFTKTQLASAAVVLVAASVLLAFPAMASTLVANPQSTQQSTQQGTEQMIQQSRRFGQSEIQVPPLTQGETISFSSSQGACTAVGKPGKTCTASGQMTLTVSGVYARGYALSLTSGTININGTTYIVSGGSLVEGEYLANIIGQRTTNDGSSFLILGHSLGNFGAKNQALVGLDFKSSGTEYLVHLLVTTTHS
jgi:hypothetical protein